MSRRGGDSSRSLVIVGAGAAGIAAAVEAADCGLIPTLLDERPLSAFAGGSRAAPGGRRRRLLNELSAVRDRVRIEREAAVLGITRNREVLWTRGRGSTLCSADAIILAAGGSPRAVPFPGWTLNGVVRSSDLATHPDRTARRALVAGTGPRLLLRAAALLERGVEVAAVLEAGEPPWQSPAAIPELRGGSDILEMVRQAWMVLIKAGVAIHTRRAVFQAHGVNSVSRVTFGSLEPGDWRPGIAHDSVDVDLLVTDFGSVSSHELATLAGCAQRYDDSVTSWVPVRESMMRATVPGIFTIGHGAGVAAALVAEEEGRIAGITAAEEAGTIAPAEAAERRGAWHERLRQRAEIRTILDQASRIRPGLLTLLTPETVICPCESVTLEAVRAAVREGGRALSAVKLQTRLGMGSCQACLCGPAAEMLVAYETERARELVGRVNARPPARAVTLGSLARMECVGVPGASGANVAVGEETR